MTTALSHATREFFSSGSRHDGDAFDASAILTFADICAAQAVEILTTLAREDPCYLTTEECQTVVTSAVALLAKAGDNLEELELYFGRQMGTVHLETRDAPNAPNYPKSGQPASQGFLGRFNARMRRGLRLSVATLVQRPKRFRLSP